MGRQSQAADTGRSPDDAGRSPDDTGRSPGRPPGKGARPARGPLRAPRPPASRTDRRIWGLAIVLTLLLHVGAVIGIRATRPFAPTPVQARPPEIVEMVFEPPPESPPAVGEDPQVFTELPEDRADTPPERPDFLSNVDSRARDQVGGGPSEAPPRMEGDTDFPQVAMTPGAREALAAPESDAPPEDRDQETADPRSVPERSPLPRVADSEEAVPESDDEPRLEPDRLPPTPETEVDERLRRAQSLAASGLIRQQPGNSDIFQTPTDNRWGNTGLTGDISLNTTAWNYAPWLMRFRREFLRDWTAPPAYYMGMIDGRHTIRLEIGLDGELLDMRLLEQEGHDSLVKTSMFSFQTIAPFESLPSGFPEKTLILTIKLVYPPLKTR